jgi:hypothetical protein
MARSCSLPSTSPFAAWPTDLLDKLCRSYVTHDEKVDGWTINSLPDAFYAGEPADFNEALTRRSCGDNVKAVYDRIISNAAYRRLWNLIDFIFETWHTDNYGFNFSVQFPEKHLAWTFLDGSSFFARDVPWMQFFHQGPGSMVSKVVVPTHQCWREVVNGSPGLHVCLKGNSIFENGIHIDPHQIVKGKKGDGTCDYSTGAIIQHGRDIRKLFGF